MADDLVLPEGFEIEGTGGRTVAPRADPGRRVYINEPLSGTSLTMPEGFEVVQDQPTWLSAITEIPKEIYRAGADAVGHIADLGKRGEQGPIEGLMTTGRAALAVPELLLSPFTGAARSLLGHPMAQLEHAAGTVIAPEIAAKDDLRKMFETSRGDVDLATAAMRPYGNPIKGVVPPIPGPVPVPGPGVRANLPEAGAFERAAGRPQWIWDRERVPRAPADIGPEQDLIAAAGRVAETTGRPIEVPTAMASDNMAIQRAGQGLRNVPVVGDAIPKATGRLIGQLDEATGAIANEYGTGTGPNVANRIGRDLEGAAEAERAAATAAAQRSDDALLAAWQREQDLASQNIAGRESGAAERARAAVGDMNPQDMGQALIARLRAGEAEARANKEALYGRAGEADAAVRADEVANARAKVAMGLHDAGVDLDPPGTPGNVQLTPAANRMMAVIEQLSGGQLPNRPTLPNQSPAPRPAVPAPAAAAPAPQAQQSLLEFLASKGGLGPDPELGAIGAHSHTVGVEGVGRRRLVKQGGWTLDYAREAAEEAGYLRGDGNKTSTVKDLLDAIDAEVRGQKRYPEGFEGHVGRREGAARSERETHEREAFVRGLEDDLAEAGHGGLGNDVKQRAMRLMENERMDPDTAVETAFRQLEQEDAAGAGFPGDRVGAPAAPSPGMPGSPISVQDIERTRQRLVFARAGATNDADRRATSAVMKQFDDWQSNAFETALLSGDETALRSFREARAANAEWRRRFFNDRDEADKFINKIVTGEVTPQEVANLIVGSGQVGAKGVASRLLTRLGEATGNDPEAMQAIRSGIWNRLSATTEGVDAKGTAKVANDINEFLSGSGRDVANRLFTPEQRAVMRTYGETLRTGQEARQTVADVSKATKPQAMAVGPGPIEELASTVLGKGGKTDEALFNAIMSYGKSGNRGDIQTLAKLVGSIPAEQKGDLVSAIVRNLGVGAEGFSPDIFATNWSGTKGFTPQAKAILFGNAGAHLKALDDIAAISLRMKQTARRFGNPSGTAQNVNIGALAAWGFAEPFSAISTAVGGTVAAHILSKPATAASAAKWSRAYAVLTARPSVQSIAAYQTASRNLANTANAFGANVSVADFMKLLQAPSRSAAEDQNQVPRPPGQ